MNPSIHGHEVMHFMIDHGGKFTREGLEQAIAERFGAEARFHTCSTQGMTAIELIDFLSARGKFTQHADGLSLGADQICNH